MSEWIPVKETGIPEVSDASYLIIRRIDYMGVSRETEFAKTERAFLSRKLVWVAPNGGYYAEETITHYLLIPELPAVERATG